MPGHNPDLVVTAAPDGTPLAAPRRVDLTAHATADALHALLRAEGFAARAGEERGDDARCAAWRDRGECVRNAAYMRGACPRACAADRDARCAAWARAGECEANARYMHGVCPAACAWKGELR